MMMQHSTIEGKGGVQEQINALFQVVESGVRLGEAGDGDIAETHGPIKMTSMTRQIADSK